MSKHIVEPIRDTGNITLGFDAQAAAAVSSRRTDSLNELLNPPILTEDASGDARQESNPQTLVSKRGNGNPYLNESDEEKIRRQQLEAEEDINRFKQERQRFLLERQLQKKHDMHQLQTYNPWGKPGNGAPRGENSDDLKRLKSLQQHQMEQQQQQLQHLQQQQQLQDSSHNDIDGLSFNKPGNGAPLRTRSGRLVTQLQGDPLLRFQEVKKGRPPIEPIRYKNPMGQQYAKELDQHMQQQAQQREFERQHELMAEIETLNYDPYGRPGAGAPNQKLRVQKTVGRFEDSTAAAAAQNSSQQQQQQLEPNWQTPSDEFHQYDPWGKGYGHPVRDQQGNVRRYPFHDKRDGSMLYPLDSVRYSFVHQPSAAEAAQQQQLQQLQQQQQQQQQQLYGEHIPPSHRYYGQQSVYHPFGKPGSGAPILDENGNVRSAVAGSAQFDANLTDRQRRALAARAYSQELEKEMIERNLNKKRERQLMREPEESVLVDQINRGIVGKPLRDPRTGQLLDQHLPSSDVTHIEYKTPRHHFKSVTGYQHLPSFVEHAESYGSELERAAAERAALKQLERMQEVQQARQHASTCDSMFGKPGAGAPYEPTIRKAKFDQVLHHPLSQRNEFKKAVNHDVPVPNTVYVRNNVRSTHENSYEASNQLNAYQFSSPIAHPES